MRWISLLFLTLLAAKAPASQSALTNGQFSGQINGTEIAWLVRGQGPVCMVVTNSWGFTAMGLHRLFSGLEAHFTMIYFDPRGMGRSGPVRAEEDRSMATVRKDLNGLRNHLGLEKTHVLGWSNGAMNAFLYVADYSEHVDKAVFVHGIAGFDEEDLAIMGEKNGSWLVKQAAFMKSLREGLEPDAQKDEKLKNFIIDEWFPQLCANPEQGKLWLRELMGDLPFSWRHMIYQGRDMAHYDARPLLSKIKCPTLVIAGNHDMLPPTGVKRAAHGIPGAVFKNFEHSGHFASIEEKDLFTEVLTSFLNGI